MSKSRAPEPRRLRKVRILFKQEGCEKIYALHRVSGGKKRNTLKREDCDKVMRLEPPSSGKETVLREVEYEEVTLQEVAG